MKSYKEQLIEVLINLREARAIIFMQIVNFDKTHESKRIKEVFDLTTLRGSYYTVDLREFENVRDPNLLKLINLCISIEDTIDDIMSDSDIDNDDVFEDDE